MPTIDEYLQSQAERFEEELCEFLRIPSISADPARREDVRRAAEWVADQFRRLGFSTEIVDTAGHPLVLASSAHVPGAPTVLVYGHYDVQPVEPLDEWISPPFEPTRRDGNIYARGATDDKGQLFTHIKSAEAWIKINGSLPVNLKYVIEGEEEVGSANLEKFVLEQSDRLACDCLVISDGGQFGPCRPAITCGLRGIVYLQLNLRGPCRDLHSGGFGGAVSNPANALARMLAALIDDRGRIQVPGFYDDVAPLSDAQREQFAALPFDEAEFMEEIGVSELHGEEGHTTLQRLWTRPTFDICGLTSGYQGEGAKTVLPATASAKLSFRLVPNQDPEKIAEGVRKILADVCPPGIEMTLAGGHGAPAVMVPIESPYVQAAVRAIEHGFGNRPVFTGEGGSIPIVSVFRQALGADVLLLGWGQKDDNTHSPNEKFCLADFHRAIKASTKLWEELGLMIDD
jgi:succinyl-diaminopimelate desuccinylase